MHYHALNTFCRYWTRYFLKKAVPYELPIDVYQEIKQCVASGQYATEDDVLREAIRALKFRDEEIAAIKAGTGDMEAGRVRSFEVVDAEIRREFGFSDR